MSKEEITAFLGAGTNYNGQLEFKGAVRIDGAFTGEITSEGTLTVGKGANIDGTVNVGELILSGTLTGKASVKKRLVIHRTGVLHGEIHSPALVLEEGACIEGSVSMQKEKNNE